MEAEKRKKLKKALDIVSVCLIVAVIASLAGAAVYVTGYGKEQPAGVIASDSLDGFRIVYSPETENAFKRSLQIYANRLFAHFLEGQTISADMLGARIILKALQNAGIPADKVAALGRYLENQEPEDALGEFILAFYLPVLDEYGEPVRNENGNIITVFNPDANLADVLTGKINLSLILDEIIQETALTPDEAGTFLYEHLMLMSNESRKELLTTLGKENFITLFIDSSEIFREIFAASKRDEITPAEGRMARELLFELGVRYRDILDGFGAENLEELIGIGGNLIDVTNLPPDIAGIEYIENVNALSSSFEGMTGYTLFLISETFVNLESGAFDSAVNYINDKDGREYSFAVLSALRTAVRAHDAAKERYGLTDQQITEKIAGVNANLRIIGGEGDYDKLDQFKEEENAALSAGLVELKKIALEDYNDIKTAEDIKAMTESDFAGLRERLAGASAGLERLEAGASRAQTLIFYSLLLKTIFSIME